MINLNKNMTPFEQRLSTSDYYPAFRFLMMQGLIITCMLYSVMGEPNVGRRFKGGERILFGLLCVLLVNGNALRQASPKRDYPTTGQHSKGRSAPITILGYRVRNRGHEYEIANLVIKNCSSKPIKEALFSWEIMSVEDGQLIERKGMDFSRIFPNTLRPGETIRLPFVVATVPKLLIGEISNSRWKLGVVLSNATFSDGTNWKTYPGIRPL